MESLDNGNRSITPEPTSLYAPYITEPERGRERFSGKKFLIHLSLIAAGGAIGWEIANFASLSGIHQIDSGLLQFVGSMIGMFVGGITAELATQEMRGTISF